LEVFAEMSARIAGGEPRADVLAAASADDAQFEASQAFWLGRMSDEARDGRVWRMMAPAKVAFATPNASVASASSAVPLAPGVATGPHTARLTIEQFAAFRA